MIKKRARKNNIALAVMFILLSSILAWSLVRAWDYDMNRLEVNYVQQN